MILRALYDYYHRCGDSLAPEGLEYKEIAFAIVIDNEGNFKRIENMLGSNKLVVKSNGRTIKSDPNHLWDNWAYVLGLSGANLLLEDESLDNEKKENRDKEIKKNKRCFKAFVEYVRNLASEYPENTDLKAVVSFYDKNVDLFKLVQNSDQWDVVKKNLTKNISFLVEGDLQIVAEKGAILSYHQSKTSTDSIGTSVCLVTGDRCEPLLTFSKIQLGKFSDTKLISFQKKQGYDSYGKKQGENAAISPKAEFAVTTALKKLVSYNSHNKYTIGDRIYVFWSSTSSEIGRLVEDTVFSFFTYSKEDQDNPNKNLEYIKRVFNSIYTGKKPTESNDMFYILGLFPANKARIAVSYWEEVSVQQFAGRILKHIYDMDIVRREGSFSNYWGVRSMLKATSLNGDIEKNCAPNLPDAVVKSIFQGIPYPTSLYQACIRRIRAEVGKEINGKKIDPVDITRAAIIKAYLNRLNDNNNKKLEIMLDKENQNHGYLCGRLFAVLDKIQEDANGIHSIRERYMNSASATPATVFATIINLSTHHIEKLNTGSQVFYEKLKQEIISKLPADGFPSHLDLQDQGRFFVGYYHQRQDFFTAKDNNE